MQFGPDVTKEFCENNDLGEEDCFWSLEVSQTTSRCGRHAKLVIS